MVTIQAKLKNKETKNTDLRNEGLIPAVFYGLNKQSTPISVSGKEFIKALKEAGESTTVTLDLGTEKVETLIHDVQVDAVTGVPVHADFLVIDMNKTIQVAVPLEFSGIAGAVKNGLGVLVKVLHEIEIEALPKNLPHELHVDISILENLDSHISVSDLILPAGVIAITPETDIIASIAAMQEEKEEETPVDLSAIEVEKKGKKEEEEGASTTEAEK
jgi:large subunit ribosomal protein L25